MFRKGNRISKNKLNVDIAPDEIFLDSSNLSDFDEDQFEGRLEKPISKRSMLSIFLSFVILALVFSSKMWFIQVKEGQAYLEISENNRLQESYLFSNRGVIYDRNGVELAYNVIHPDEEDFSKRKFIDLPGFSHLLGYIKYPAKDKDGFYWETSFIGKDGVEKFYNDLLTGRNGREIIEINALGEISSQGLIEHPQDGENISLAIDSRIQTKLFEIIEETSQKVNFQGGGGAIMDIKTGEIITLVSYPEYNSGIISDGENTESIREFLNDPYNPFLNRIVSGLYVPGSVVKPFMTAAALNEGIIDPNKSILSTGSISIPNPYFPDKPSVFTDWKAHGWVNAVDALAVSSNVYFYAIGGGFADQTGLGIERIEKYMRMFGLGEKSNIDIPGEIVGVIPNPSWKEKTFNGDEWRLGDTYNTSIGQYGFQLTPIQILRGISAIANGGVLLNPTVLKIENVGESETISIKKEVLEIVKEGMRQSAKRGTAAGLSVPYVEIGAKTGTAEIGKKYLNSWVTGFFPFENPKYAFVIIMERGPRGNTTGGVYVMRQLLDWMNQNTPQYFEN